MEIKSLKKFVMVVHEYPDFHLTMHSYICTCKNSVLELTEHIDFRWLDKSELKGLDWAAADVPIVEKLMTR